MAVGLSIHHPELPKAIMTVCLMWSRRTADHRRILPAVELVVLYCIFLDNLFSCLSLVFGIYYFNPLGNSALADFCEWQNLSLDRVSSDNTVTKTAFHGQNPKKIGKNLQARLFPIMGDYQWFTSGFFLLVVIPSLSDAECEARRRCKNLQKSKHW